VQKIGHLPPSFFLLKRERERERERERRRRRRRVWPVQNHVNQLSATPRQADTQCHVLSELDFSVYLTAVFPDQGPTEHHMRFWEKSWHKINENCEIL